MPEINLNKKYLNWILGIFISLNAFVIFLGLGFMQDKLFLLGAAAALVFASNWIIAAIAERWHVDAGTGEVSSGDNPLWSSLKRITGFAEIIFYTALIIFHQWILLAAWLIVKAVGDHGAARFSEGGGSMSPGPEFSGGSTLGRTAATAAIVRLGTLLSLGTAAVAAVLVVTSGIKSTQLFKFITAVFS